MIRFKPGVDFSKSSSEIWRALFIAEEVYDDHDLICVVTAGQDGKHKEKSKHYLDNPRPFSDAFDLRTRQMSLETAQQIVVELRARLGRDYDVVLELDKLTGRPHHIHLEYDPKGDL